MNVSNVPTQSRQRHMPVQHYRQSRRNQACLHRPAQAISKAASRPLSRRQVHHDMTSMPMPDMAGEIASGRSNRSTENRDLLVDRVKTLTLCLAIWQLTLHLGIGLLARDPRLFMPHAVCFLHDLLLLCICLFFISPGSIPRPLGRGALLSPSALRDYAFARRSRGRG